MIEKWKFYKVDGEEIIIPFDDEGNLDDSIDSFEVVKVVNLNTDEVELIRFNINDEDIDDSYINNDTLIAIENLVASKCDIGIFYNNEYKFEVKIIEDEIEKIDTMYLYDEDLEDIDISKIIDGVNRNVVEYRLNISKENIEAILSEDMANKLYSIKQKLNS